VPTTQKQTSEFVPYFAQHNVLSYEQDAHSDGWWGAMHLYQAALVVGLSYLTQVQAFRSQAEHRQLIAATQTCSLALMHD